MKTIFIVCGGYEENIIYDVYDTEEEAQKHADALNEFYGDNIIYVDKKEIQHKFISLEQNVLDIALTDGKYIETITFEDDKGTHKHYIIKYNNSLYVYQSLNNEVQKFYKLQ